MILILLIASWKAWATLQRHGSLVLTHLRVELNGTRQGSVYPSSPVISTFHHMQLHKAGSNWSRNNQDPINLERTKDSGGDSKNLKGNVENQIQCIGLEPGLVYTHKHLHIYMQLPVCVYVYTHIKVKHQIKENPKAYGKVSYNKLRI